MQWKIISRIFFLTMFESCGVLSQNPNSRRVLGHKISWGVGSHGCGKEPFSYIQLFFYKIVKNFKKCLKSIQVMKKRCWNFYFYPSIFLMNLKISIIFLLRIFRNVSCFFCSIFFAWKVEAWFKNAMHLGCQLTLMKQSINVRGLRLEPPWGEGGGSNTGA